ncbi:MAG: DUF3048 domain-containing protein [Anaerolineae bacterium]|nr:DUF3048 domain-containing protein [Anaerolineae bacterium]
MVRQVHSCRLSRTRLIRIAVLVSLLLAGCATLQTRVITVTSTPEPSTTTPTDPPPTIPAPTDPALSQVIGPFFFPDGYNPLTGLPVADPAALDRRPLAVKISNAPDSVRPQAGIAEADLVFEHYVEGDLTRFTAIFWSRTPPRVGSIRSARLIDLELPSMYGALFVYSGAAEPIRQRITESLFAARAYEGVTTGPPLYYRDPGIEVPHNLFAVPSAVWERASADGLNDPPDNLGGMAFSAAPPDGDLRAQQVTIDYGPDVVRWNYDAESGRYRRWVDDEAHTDANTGDQVTAANVVLVYAHHQPDLSIVENEWQGKKSYSLELQIWTLGPATVFRDGQMVQGYWMRWEEEAMLSFWLDEDAEQMIPLKPGNTWFEVVPLDFTSVLVE